MLKRKVRNHRINSGTQLRCAPFAGRLRGPLGGM